MSGSTTAPSSDTGELRWPPVSWADYAWVADTDAPVSRRERARHQGPYRAAVLAAVEHADPGLSSALSAECADAAAEMVRFDADADALLGRGEVAPLASVLLRSESAASSQIENLTVGAGQLALAELGLPATGNAALVAGNVAAMTAAVRLADGMDVDALLAMHRALMGDTDPDAGRLRTEQVWIGGSATGPHEAMFVPPHHAQVEAALDDLVRFTRRTDLPVLAHAALAHAQFETIHPFTDGNGRTGRALIHAMLRGARLTRRLTVPISAGLLSEVESYFAALTAYRDGDPSPIVHRLNEAVWSALANARLLIEELATLRADWEVRLTARKGSGARRALDVVLAQPVVHVRHVAQRLDLSPTAAQTAVDALVAAGILMPSGTARRNRTWQAGEVLDALDTFARRSQRRHLPRL
jgi:Fic family protein